MPARRKSVKKKASTAHLGFEARLWLAADSRVEDETAAGNRSNNMDAAEPSGARQTARQGSPKGERGGANQYNKAENVFWVPAYARSTPSRACGTNAKQPTIGKTVDDAMIAIERRWQLASAEAQMWN